MSHNLTDASGIRRIPRKKKIAFVCSGGAVKAGCFHLGVALALQEKGFVFRGGLSGEAQDQRDYGDKISSRTLGEISCYVGSSAGSFVAAMLASGISLRSIFCSFLRKPIIEGRKIKPLSYGQMLRVNRPRQLFKAAKLPHLKDLFFPTTYRDLLKATLHIDGLFNTNGIEEYFRKEVLNTNDFSDLDPELFCVATQLNHSQKVVFGKEPHPDTRREPDTKYDPTVSISDAVAASAALPPIYSPYGIKKSSGNTVYYFDGEIRDTLSTHVAVDHGADLVIASYTHQPYHFQKDIGSLTKFGIPSIMIQAIYLLVEKKIQVAIDRRQRKVAAMEAVRQYCEKENVSKKTIDGIIQLLEDTLLIKRDVDVIHIHPQPDDTQMFFGNHFNLGPKNTSQMVRTGYRSAMNALRNIEFES
jgi:predicted acylesterase/phospholipase RssA